MRKSGLESRALSEAVLKLVQVSDSFGLGCSQGSVSESRVLALGQNGTGHWHVYFMTYSTPVPDKCLLHV